MNNKTAHDFVLFSQSGTCDCRDLVKVNVMHQEILDAMITMDFNPIEIQSLMRLVAAVLYIGNMRFVEYADGAILV